MTTRVGDVIFLLGILGIWTTIGSVSFVDIYAALANGSFEGQTVIGVSLTSFIAFCIFAGTIGKSAQFPLQVWLPDAMMGPTPCSALIHAATMVAAGVYLSLRMYPMMVAGEMTTFIASIGAITAFGAATIALIQTDIKAVLAFSTISQLGYMVVGIGVGSYNAAFMHLITHAVFKACLFLSAGSVIHSLHDPHTHTHVQEMPRMGGLRKKLPFTFIAMAFCTLAIAGVPFFAGFVSKDRILGDAFYWGFMQNPKHFLVPLLGFGGALLTAFYMSRMMFLTFFGEPRDKEVFDHCHEEHIGWNSNIPLLILSVFTLGLFYSGSLTGQGIVKVFSEKYEWFDVLIKEPKVENFKFYKRQPLELTSDSTTASGQVFPRSQYIPHDHFS
jgi:NADH-quinone oxidoreductase subunit L